MDKFNLNAIVNRTKIKITLFINASCVLLVDQKYYYFLYFAFYAKLLALYETRGTKVWLKIVFVHISVYFFFGILLTLGINIIFGAYTRISLSIYLYMKLYIPITIFLDTFLRKRI